MQSPFKFRIVKYTSTLRIVKQTTVSNQENYVVQKRILFFFWLNALGWVQRVQKRYFGKLVFERYSEARNWLDKHQVTAKNFKNQKVKQTIILDKYGKPKN